MNLNNIFLVYIQLPLWVLVYRLFSNACDYNFIYFTLSIIRIVYVLDETDSN